MNVAEQRLVSVLRNHPEGCLFNVLTREAKVREPMYAHQITLKNLPGVFIDRWEWSPVRLDYIPVYKLVTLPDDAPKPEIPK